MLGRARRTAHIFRVGMRLTVRDTTREVKAAVRKARAIAGR